MENNNKQRKPSLTTFNFQTPEDNTNEEGVFSKIIDKVISAVSGQPLAQDNVSVRTYNSSHNDSNDNKRHSNNSIQKSSHSRVSSVDQHLIQPHSALPNSISSSSSLSKHLTTASSSTTSTTTSLLNKDTASIAHFPASLNLDTVPRPSASTTATTATTVTVGNQKLDHQLEQSVEGDSKEPVITNNNSAVQFIIPEVSSSSRRSQEDSRASLDHLLNSPLTKKKSIDSDTQSVVTNFSISNSNSLSRILARLRGQKSDKEFWMPDEQCKECYKCRKAFTLLRRKHHCRTCGQIFCGRCASHIISGKMHKQKGQVRVCNFCYAEQLQQLKENMSATNADSQTAQQITSGTATKAANVQDKKRIEPSQQQQQSEQLQKISTYDSAIIPSQKPPLAVPQMQIPTTALRQTRSTYGNKDTTMFALEIPTHASESYYSGSPIASSAMGEMPYFANTSYYFDQYNNASLDSPLLPHSNNNPFIPTITTTSASNTDLMATAGLKRLLDAGTSLLKSTTTSRPRSNTSSSAPMEETRYHVMPQYGSSNYPSSPYLLNRGGGTVLAESELSPFVGKSATEGLYQDHPHNHHLVYQNTLLLPPPSPASPTPPSYNEHQSDTTVPKFGEQLSVAAATVKATGSDDESYDNRLRVKRTEELRGKSYSRTRSFNSARRLSFTGSNSSNDSSRKRLIRNSLVRINTAGLPKSDYGMESNWSPNPLLSPYVTDGTSILSNVIQPQPEASTSMSRLRLPIRKRRISGPPQTVELSLSARSHMRKILKQLMNEINLSDQSEQEWEDVIMNILLKVANNVQPDIRSGDDMDVRHYVKIKKIPGGLPLDSFYVKGVMCTKNVAHKRMAKNISHPRILILMFSLDYSRVEMENQLLSIAPVISQEREHIRKLVNRIVALKPSLLLVKSTVSRLALECLLEANIPVIHNVKHSVIEAVARCTQASIVTSVDKLQHGLSFGRCGSFEIRTIIHEWIPNRRKTFLVFDDCSPDLGGTIVLRGAKMETLCVIKRLIDFMVFVVNNLKLETSLMLDSFAKNRNCTDNNTTAQFSTNATSSERNRSPLISLATADNKMIAQSGESIHSTVNAEYEDEENQTVNSHYVTDLLKIYQNTILSVSQFVVFPPPYLLLALKAAEDKLVLFNNQKRRKSASGSSIMTNTTTARDSIVPLSASPTRSTFDKQSIYSSKFDDHHHRQYDQHLIINAECDLIAKSHQISRAWDAYIGENPASISPFYHQNIVVLYSSVCTVTTVPCQGPEIRIFSYYRLPSDKTLGQYVMDFCNDARQPCASFMCEHPMMQHYRSYAHSNARVNVMIEQFPCPLPGIQDKLLTWSYCKECDKPTPVLPVSQNTWNYSFGKFLEVFLYQKDVYCRADICPHDMARNHVRYFGYMNLTVRFQYDPIELLEVTAPPTKLFIQSQIQMDIKDAELKLLRSKINKFYQSIVERNKAFPFDLVNPSKLELCKSELQELSLEAQKEKKDALQMIQNVYANSDPYDTLSLNSARRNLFQLVNHWENLYVDFVAFYLQPERELKKITTIQLRKMFPTDLSDAAIFNMDNERTERVTEMTDLPLLGIDLDGEDDDALIGHVVKQKTTATKSDEIKAKASHQMIFPTLSSSSIDESTDNTANSGSTSDPDQRSSFLRVEIRRRLSLELMHELDAKVKSEEANATGIEALNRIASNKCLRVKSPGTLSSTFTPSRIPIPRSGRNSISGSPPIYEPFSRYQRSKMASLVENNMDSEYNSNQRHKRNNLKSMTSAEKKDTLVINDSKTNKQPEVGKMSRSSSFSHIHQRGPYLHRHRSNVHGDHFNHDQPRMRYEDNFEDEHDEDEADELSPISYLHRSVTTRNRRFRSRLPRKKTYIQVYTEANDLVQEDIDDEFYAGGDQLDDSISVTSHQKKFTKRNYSSDYFSTPSNCYPLTATSSTPRRSMDNGDEADYDDNDITDDAEDDSDKENIDYFSSLAPYTHKVIEGAAAVLEGEHTMTVADITAAKGVLKKDYSSSKRYFPFSDGQSSGMSGSDNERDLPSANELLMAQQSDGMNLTDLPNIDLNAIDDSNASAANVTRASIAEALEDGRHSPEKISFMKTLTNLLTDSGVGNLLPLDSPLLSTEYLFPDSYVVVREDEPSTIIAYTLSSEDYIDKMHDIQDYSSADNRSTDGTIKPGDASIVNAKASSVALTAENPASIVPTAEAIQETLLRESGTHMRYNFSTGSTKFFCKIFFSEQFDALRRNCGCDESYIMSLASCIKWDSSGGKSGSVFLKTKDDRLLMKQMSKYELDAFLGFAPAYFQYMSEAFFSELPTVLAKIFGFYSIGYKNSATGKSMRMDVLVMENLFYQRNVKKIFDLKGSMRNRHVQSTGKQDEVLLDENLVELIYQSPLFIRSHSKEILRSSLHNDTLFLSNRGVMDYSLLVGIDEERQELVVGIVDFIRTFTWDKKLESWVKETGILGGGGKGPTIVSPRQYRIRFREAMERYFLMVPDYWALTRQSRSTYATLHHHAISDSDGE